ncbi:Protein of unknown function [Pustulibacterium marinum]|uniref:DUF2911 domain-containing protein n=1 Tax=Pustulibacterium marinum TaxID=1224947 RepID=A0A1I7FWD9_9FLAO|nr:DUF2911 domain-containing protein [Pustulibacterium marinum]SFU40497.1 Protein of unknown function [Pustulibacterium marinum]
MKITPIIVTLLVFITFSSNVQAQKFSGLDKSPHDISYYRQENNASPVIKILYGRPQLRGRGIGKEIAPYGKLWRTGANEATEIQFYKDVMIGDSLITSGTYSLFTIPDKKEWTVILNNDIDVWGAYTYDPNQDVVRLKVPAETDKESLDALSIVFDDEKGHVEMAIGWGKTRVFVPITVAEKHAETEETEIENPSENESEELQQD